MSEESRKKALNTAANVLQYRNRSSRDLLERLLEKGVEESDAKWAVSRLQELGLLSDSRYAADIARGYAMRGYGAGRVRQELRKKHISDEDIESAMEEFTPDMDKALAFAAGKLSRKNADRKDVKRVHDALFRRGFSYEEISDILRRYTSELEDNGEL